MAKEALILFYGGCLAERRISVLSAESVMRAINYDKFSMKTYFITRSGDFVKTQKFSSKPADDERLMTNATVVEGQKIKPSDIYEKGTAVSPILRGPMGEDGSIQGFLEILKMPYVGTNILSSSIAMNKISTKHVLKPADVPLITYVTYVEGTDLERAVAEINERLTYPVFIKPTNMGPSVGISKADGKEGLRSAIDLALKYDSRILIGTGVNTREVEAGILRNADVQTTLPGEVVKDVTFYDYDAKYIDNKITMDIPTHIGNGIMEEIRDYATIAFRIIDGCDLSRCDFFLTEDSHVYLNELNTMPGFAQWSMCPLLWENMGPAYSDLIKKLVELVREMFEEHESHLI